jgi:hypothetical protein
MVHSKDSTLESQDHMGTSPDPNDADDADFLYHPKTPDASRQRGS